MHPAPCCEFASKMQASRCLFHDFYDLTHFTRFSPGWEAQFWKTISSTFDQTYNFFDHQTASKWSFCHYCLLLLLCCSFGSLCVYLLPPSKTACSSTPVLFLRPSPFCKNDGMYSTCKFINFVCNLLFSLRISCFSHAFLPLFCHFFWKSVSRHRWGVWFWKPH